LSPRAAGRRGKIMMMMMRRRRRRRRRKRKTMRKGRNSRKMTMKRTRTLQPRTASAPQRPCADPDQGLGSGQGLLAGAGQGGL
jgi:hypothetical protein